MTFKKLLEPLSVTVSLITGSSEKTELNSDVIIGTHALLYSNAPLKGGGLVVVDEQHKFGVAQRAKIIELLGVDKRVPHLLTMTATPIPRTLALAYLGDLDISILKESPMERKGLKPGMFPKVKELQLTVG